MLPGGITFGTNISSDLQKFVANPNQTYRAAVLHYVDANQQLQPIIRAKRGHFHQTDGQQGLGSFICLSTEENVASCCKNTAIFGDPIFKIAIPIILYPSDFQGNVIQGGTPDVQVLLIYERGWAKLNQINKSYPLSSNDFTISGKKQGRGVSLDFMPAGPAYWQSDQSMFAALLNKAKVLMEGPGLAGVDRLLGRNVTLQDVENALRVAQGLPPALPTPPNMPALPPMPMMGAVAPPQIPAGVGVPAIPAGVAPPTPAAPAAPTPVPTPAAPVAPTPVAVAAASGPASPAQMSAIANLIAPPDGD
jgi:hypothetical protein